MESTMNENITRSRAMDKAEAVKNDVKKRVKDGVETVERETSELGDTVARGASDLAEAVNTRLKTVGVDTGVMADLAKDQVSELQRMIGDELRARPMRALGIAAAIGVFVGLITAR
jgi:ElaB/YqjD/DUF883 family membrane-anchored ribosome-binding protein